MTWEFEGEARDLRDTITCIRNQDVVDNGDLQRLLDALLPPAIKGSVGNHHLANIDDKYESLLCGATSNDNAGARCSMAPHDGRWHSERDPVTDELHAEWTSMLPKDDDERLWPDGHIGPRLPADRMKRLRESR